MRQIDRTTERMFLRDRDTGNFICKIEQATEKKQVTTYLVIQKRDHSTNALTPVARFAYYTKMRPIDLLKRKAHRTYPYLESTTDKDLIDEVRRRALLNLDAVSDGAVYEEALNRGLIPVNDEHIPEHPASSPVDVTIPADDCITIYDDPTGAALEPAPPKKKGFLARFRRQKA